MDDAIKGKGVHVLSKICLKMSDIYGQKLLEGRKCSLGRRRNGSPGLPKMHLKCQRHSSISMRKRMRKEPNTPVLSNHWFHSEGLPYVHKKPLTASQHQKPCKRERIVKDTVKGPKDFQSQWAEQITSEPHSIGLLFKYDKPSLL